MAENKVKFGLSNVHIAKITEEDGVINYGTPFAMPGAKSLTADPEGEQTPFYVDNIKYYIATSNQGYYSQTQDPFWEWFTSQNSAYNKSDYGYTYYYQNSDTSTNYYKRKSKPTSKKEAFSNLIINGLSTVLGVFLLRSMWWLLPIGPIIGISVIVKGITGGIRSISYIFSPHKNN